MQFHTYVIPPAAPPDMTGTIGTFYEREDRRIRNGNTQANASTQSFADLEREGVLGRDQKGMRRSNHSNKHDQLQQIVASTHTLGICTSTPFIGRVTPTTRILCKGVV